MLFEPALPEDAEQLVALRIFAMQASLEKIGRFDAQRARDRFLAGFEAQHTRHVLWQTQKVGFVVLKPLVDHLLLDHLYVHPAHQGKGLGAAVVSDVFEQARVLNLAVRVGALRGSDSNRFYLRCGFKLVEEAEWDNYYLWKPGKGGAAA